MAGERHGRGMETVCYVRQGHYSALNLLVSVSDNRNVVFLTENIVPPLETQSVDTV